VFETARPGDIAHSQAAIDKISAALGYVPTHQIADGMAETVNWFAERLKKS
jgi:nucleoside-diphosphate-sugar epimerase